MYDFENQARDSLKELQAGCAVYSGLAYCRLHRCICKQTAKVTFAVVLCRSFDCAKATILCAEHPEVTQACQFLGMRCVYFRQASGLQMRTGVAAVCVTTALVLSLCGTAQAATFNDTDVLNFALNLEVRCSSHHTVRFACYAGNQRSVGRTV